MGEVPALAVLRLDGLTQIERHMNEGRSVKLNCQRIWYSHRRVFGRGSTLPQDYAETESEKLHILAVSGLKKF